MAWVLPGLIFFAIFLLVCLLAWRFPARRPTTYGSADWATVWQAYENGLFDKKGLIVGDWDCPLPVHYDLTHAITFGATGGGKGTSAVLPNLLQYPFIFLLDPGGENSAIASKHWRQSGYEFRCINFFGEHTAAPWELPTHGFNPLDLLDPQSDSFEADALVLAEMLIKRSGSEAGNTVFFKETAQARLRDFIVHCKTAEPKQRQNLATIFGYLNSAPDDWKRLLGAMKANPTGEGLVRAGAIALERQQRDATEEFSAVISTMQEDLNWLTDPRVRRFMSRSDVDFSVLKNAGPGAVISVVLPLKYNRTHAAISRLALACAVLTMERSPVSRNKVLFLIDEAADLGAITRLPDWLATLRKYRVMFWPIFQNIGQVAALYGRAWQTVIANCGMLQILSVGNELETPEFTEKLLGKCTIMAQSVNHNGEVSQSQTARPLMFADELRRLELDRQIIFLGNLPTLKLRKTPYFHRAEFAGRYHPNPYLNFLTPEPGLADRIAARWGRVYYAFIWWMAPHPIAATIMITPLLLWAFASIVGGR